jgi:hypothetical protein
MRGHLGMQSYKKWVTAGIALSMTGILAGCTTTSNGTNLATNTSGNNAVGTPVFNDQNVHFKLINHQSKNGDELYTIQVSSSSPLELHNLTMYLSYPIKVTNGRTANPFAVEGQASKAIIVDLEKGQSIKFTFNAPIKEVFGNSKLLDFKEPQFALHGYTEEGNKELPFFMGGDIQFFLQHK